MAHIEIRRFIAATPEAVWEILADLEHQAEWMVDVRKLEVVTEQKQGAGVVLRVTSELFGLPLVRDVMEITAWEPPYRMDVVHRGQFHGRGSFRLDRVDDGTTFTWIEDLRPPLGQFGEIAFAAVVRPHLLRVFGRSMGNLSRLAQGARKG